MGEFTSPAEESRIEDLLASRSFVLEDFGDGPRLTGLSFKQPILEGINEAHCPIKDHATPSDKCSCGFYVYDEPSGGLWGSRPANSVDAVVRISGRVVVHDRGVRAQCMEILALASTDSETRDELLKVAPKTPLFENLEDALLEFPISKLDRPTRHSSWRQDLKEGALFVAESLLMVVLLLSSFMGLAFAISQLPGEPVLPSAIALVIYMGLAYARAKLRRYVFWIFTKLLRLVSVVVAIAGFTGLTLRQTGLIEIQWLAAANLWVCALAILVTMFSLLLTFLVPIVAIEPMFNQKRIIVSDPYVKAKIFKPPHD